MPKVKLKMIDKLAPFLFKKKRFKVAFGGRAGTKSQTIAEILLHRVAREGIKVGCLREHQNSIEESVHSLLVERKDKLGIPGYKTHKTRIDHSNGGRFAFKGLSRNVDGLKSAHGFKVFWLEEAQFISKRSLKMITPTLRESESECWLTLNPDSRLDHVSQRFIVPFWKDLLKHGVYEDDLHYIVWTNYDENPWMPESLELERQHDYVHLPRAEYDHVWRGFFNDTVENAIILAEWFDACVDAHKKLGFEATGIETVSHDPSDSGYDDKGLVHRHGSVIIEAKRSQIADINEGLDWAIEYAIMKGVDHFNWDADGMGLGLKRQVVTGFKGEDITYELFRGSEGVDNPKDLFEYSIDEGKKRDKRKQRTNKQALTNLRAQYYWLLRMRCYKTYLAVTKPEYRRLPPDELISFSSKIEDLEQLRSEICSIPRKPNTNGKIQIMNKKEMKQNDIDSPNVADPCMMSLRLPESVPKAKRMKYKNPWSK